RALVLDNDRREEVAEATGLSFGRTRALRRLADGPLSMGALADELGTDAPYVTLIVDDLEARGLLLRAPDDRDRRRKVVTLTPLGRRAARTAARILAEPPAALRALAPGDLDVLAGLLAPLDRTG
ncbi:MAG: MarR family transcriptional regulator, partial [Actinobacteria bacterium]|nr:MarR family transcriptional regulator [Actinomycetota bacterium]